MAHELISSAVSYHTVSLHTQGAIKEKPAHLVICQRYSPVHGSEKGRTDTVAANEDDKWCEIQIKRPSKSSPVEV